MSERTHSSSATRSRRTRIVPILTGTAILLVAAVVGLQFFAAHPAASQTAETEPGRATLSNSPSSRVMAKVNGQPITFDTLARECVSRHGKEILDNIIHRTIIEQECERRGITVTEEDVQQEVANTAKKFNLPLDTWYQMLESERGLTPSQYHHDIIWPMLALKRLAGQQVQVSEEDMKIGFERNYGPRVKARLILVEGNIRQAGQIWEECKANPDDFDRIAREKSADPNTRPLGGVIPPISRHNGNKQIEDQAFRLQPGEISPVIQIGENRSVIIKCEGHTEPVVTDIREVWDVLYEQLVEEKTQKAVATVFEEIKDRSRVDNFLTNKSTGARVPIQQTSGTRAAPGTQTVQPAAATRPAQPGGPATR